jgi:predicted short-subunit dehydrogenase-like oxidoreductase (DUF2520 family)
VIETVAIVGPGRAGRSFDLALRDAGLSCIGLYGRHAHIAELADLADLVLLTVPDSAIERVAGSIRPGRAVIAHVSGSQGLGVLEPHTRVASLHPLVSLPNADVGRTRLASGIVFAVDGDRAAREIAERLGGRPIVVDDEHRPLYHAAAAIASNHLIVLCAQVDRLAREVGVPVDAYWDLMATTLDNVRSVGPQAALTGPASRGDLATLRSHLGNLDPAEHALYRVLAEGAAHLAGAALQLDPGGTEPGETEEE